MGILIKNLLYSQRRKTKNSGLLFYSPTLTHLLFGRLNIPPKWVSCPPLCPFYTLGIPALIMMFSSLHALYCQESIEYSLFLSPSLQIGPFSISLPHVLWPSNKACPSQHLYLCYTYSLQQFLPPTPSLILKSHPFSGIIFKCHLLHNFS